jgi:hypothetical protein
MTLAELQRQKEQTDCTAGENLQRLRKLAQSADRREGTSLKNLSRKERRRRLAGS